MGDLEDDEHRSPMGFLKIIFEGFRALKRAPASMAYFEVPDDHRCRAITTRLAVVVAKMNRMLTLDSWSTILTEYRSQVILS